MEAAVKRVEIKGFRCISSFEAPLSRITVLVGGNNTGKTSILEALALLLTYPRGCRDVTGEHMIEVIGKRRGGPQHLVKIGEPLAKVSAELSEKHERLALYAARDLTALRVLGARAAGSVEEIVEQLVEAASEGRARRMKKRLEQLKYSSPLLKPL